MDLREDFLLTECFEAVRPDVVINAAAVVNLQKCEKAIEETYRTNSRLCSVLSMLSKKYRSYFVHVSTDHYYCGDNKKKHKETDELNLVNEYARSKFAGEMFALTNPNAVVLRTNIVGFRKNGSPTFLEWAINSMRQKEKMTLFDDFFTSSMHVKQFAEITMDIVQKRLIGIYNVASSEVSSKKDFILSLSQILFHREPFGYTTNSVKNFSGVKRADSLGLDVNKIETCLDYQMPDLEKVLYSIKQEIVAEGL